MTDTAKRLALAVYLEIPADDITPSPYDDERDTQFDAGGLGDWLVLTDDEANDAEDDALDSYIDDCLEIPEALAPYFDREAWKRDARFDGRGHCISHYDGDEHELDNPDTGRIEFFAYRTN